MNVFLFGRVVVRPGASSEDLHRLSWKLSAGGMANGVHPYLGRSVAMQQFVPATLASNPAHEAPDGAQELPFLLVGSPVAELSEGVLRVAELLTDEASADASTAFEIGLLRVQRLLMGWLSTKDVESIELFCATGAGRPFGPELLQPADIPPRIRDAVHGERTLPTLRAILYPED